eukprot:scaffold77683_cov73-Phaeocystis_antarctica.AAC.1
MHPGLGPGCAPSQGAHNAQRHTCPPRRGCGHGRDMAAPMIPEAVNDLVVAGKPYSYLDSDVGMPRLHHDSCDSDDEQLKAHGPTRVFQTRTPCF